MATKTKNIHIRVDEEFHAEAHAFAQGRKTKLSQLLIDLLVREMHASKDKS